ncbi:TolC family protein [Labilibaculum sp.]|uniref:TolC family protein n=1 Tax=Labilibaculum sp. TaxID=2060723 RepID=UPI0035619088
MKNRKIIYGIVSLAFAATSLPSCFVAKKYQRPEIEIQDQYRDVNTNDSSTLAAMPWEELFTDTNLTSLINEALDNNLDLLMAVERVNAAEAYYKQGKAGYLPTLAIAGSGQRVEYGDNTLSGVSNSYDGGIYHQYDLSASVTWEADIWGKIRSNKRASQATYLKSEASRRAVQSTLVATMASAYFQLVALDAQAKVTSQTVTNRKEGLETMISLKNAGRVTQAAVKQTEAQLYTTEILLIDIKENINLLENTISLLLGRNSGTIKRSSLDDQALNVELSTGFPSQLLRNRPDVILAEYNFRNAFELTNVAKSSFYPTLSMSASGGFQTLDFDNWFNSNALISNAIANLTQPIFNKRSIRTQYEVAKANQEEAKYNLKKALLSASKEVSDALYSYKTQQERYKIRQKELDALSKAVEYSEELLNNGYQNTTYIEVLTARTNALSSEISTINTKYQQLNSIVELYLSLGGGWK